jgi:hypothetical protein
MRQTILAAAVTLLAAPLAAQTSPQVTNDLTVTMTPQQYRICNDRPGRPTWMDEVHPREAYKALTLMRLYELRSWETIFETGDCGCDVRFPSWDASASSTRNGSRQASASGAHSPQLALELRRTRSPATFRISAKRKATGNEHRQLDGRNCRRLPCRCGPVPVRGCGEQYRHDRPADGHAFADRRLHQHGLPVPQHGWRQLLLVPDQADADRALRLQLGQLQRGGQCRDRRARLHRRGPGVVCGRGRGRGHPLRGRIRP